MLSQQYNDVSNDGCPEEKLKIENIHVILKYDKIVNGALYLWEAHKLYYFYVVLVGTIYWRKFYLFNIKY